MSRNIFSKLYLLYDVFLHKLVASSMWWSKTLLKKVNKVNNVEVNIKISHVIYGVSYDFNAKGCNSTIWNS